MWAIMSQPPSSELTAGTEAHHGFTLPASGSVHWAGPHLLPALFIWTLSSHGPPDYCCASDTRSALRSVEACLWGTVTEQPPFRFTDWTLRQMFSLSALADDFLNVKVSLYSCFTDWSQVWSKGESYSESHRYFVISCYYPHFNVLKFEIKLRHILLSRIVRRCSMEREGDSYFSCQHHRKQLNRFLSGSDSDTELKHCSH